MSFRYPLTHQTRKANHNCALLSCTIKNTPTPFNLCQDEQKFTFWGNCLQCGGGDDFWVTHGQYPQLKCNECRKSFADDCDADHMWEIVWSDLSTKKRCGFRWCRFPEKQVKGGLTGKLPIMFMRHKVSGHLYCTNCYQLLEDGDAMQAFSDGSEDDQLPNDEKESYKRKKT